MSYQLRWTPESTQTFNQNIEYLSTEWDSKVLTNFLNRVDEVLKLIEENPLLYPVHRVSANVHKCVVHKRLIVYYRIVDHERIDLLTFWNTYQDPSKLKL